MSKSVGEMETDDLIGELRARFERFEREKGSHPTATEGAEHPMQPVVMVEGIARFKANEIVRYLLDHGGIDMNRLACLPFTRKDREQFAQLIGYSVSGAHDLPYVSDAVLEQTDVQVERLIEAEKKCAGCKSRRETPCPGKCST